jgi:hypothetical protein
MAFIKLQVRRDSAASWTSANPILSSGEHGYETDTGKFKIGDGVTAWAAVVVAVASGGRSPAALRRRLICSLRSAPS